MSATSTSTTICPKCNAILDAPDDAEGIACTDCGSVLRLRRGPTRTDAVVITGWEAEGGRVVDGQWQPPVSERAQALAALEAEWRAEEAHHMRPAMFVLGRVFTRRRPSFKNAVFWVGFSLMAAVLQIRVAGRDAWIPPWWISAAATVAAGLMWSYVEYAAAADLAQVRKRYEAMRTAIVVGQPVDLRDLARPGASTGARWSGPKVALVIVLLVTAATAAAVFARAGYFG